MYRAPDLVALFASADFWSAVLRIATPLIFGTLGALLCERAGVLNLGIEGIMVAGALAGWLAVYQGASLWIGVLAAALAGAAFGLLHAFLTVSLALSQHVSGLGITLFATSASYYAYRVTFPNVSTPPTIQPFAEMSAIPIPVLVVADAADVGRARSRVPILAGSCTGRRLGSRCGWSARTRRPSKARASTSSRLRTGAVVAGSALMGVAGAFLTLSAFNAFYFNMVNGRGWICIALVVFAGWRPGKALAGALLFAFFDALQLRLQQQAGGIPYQLYLMAPYLLSIVALVIVARRATYPHALMRPWRKGER